MFLSLGKYLGSTCDQSAQLTNDQEVIQCRRLELSCLHPWLPTPTKIQTVDISFNLIEEMLIDWYPAYDAFQSIEAWGFCCLLQALSNVA